MARKYASAPTASAETSADWRELSAMNAFRLVVAGKLDQDLFEDFFQLKPIELENLIWLIRTS